MAPSAPNWPPNSTCTMRPPARAWLRENELDDDGGCQLRRVIRADGGSRAWINGRPATLAQLSELGGRLVEIHGQHEHQALLDRAHQLALLDAFGRHAAAAGRSARPGATLGRDRTRTGRAVARRRRRRARRLAGTPARRTGARSAGAESDIDELLAAHRRQANAAEPAGGCDTALARLAGDDGTVLSREACTRCSGELSRHSDTNRAWAKSTPCSIRPRSSWTRPPPARAPARRPRPRPAPPRAAGEPTGAPARPGAQAPGAACSNSPAAAMRWRAELEGLRGAGRAQPAPGLRTGCRQQQWARVAARLSAPRQLAAGKLEGAVCALMDELGMGGGVFAIELPANETRQAAPQGAERCEFLVSANPGQPPRPLRKVASGGELARISLAIEVAALGLDAVPTMVFDEVDTGIGGAVAEVVGPETAGPGRRAPGAVRDPPAAGRGAGPPSFPGQQGRHRQQHPERGAAGSTTKARIEELARMLGGVEITREAPAANARQMLEPAPQRPEARLFLLLGAHVQHQAVLLDDVAVLGRRSASAAARSRGW